MTQITSENIANNTITTSQIATASVASLQGPRITSITVTDASYSALDDVAVNTSGGYIKIAGANFASGCSVVIGTTSATTVTFTDSTELRVAVPALSAGSYTVYVTNTDGGLAIKVNGLTYSTFPAWSTNATLTPAYETSNVNVNLSATSDSSITYTVNAGSSLPSGLILSNSGVLSGTLPSVASDTNYSFVIQATDAELQNTPRTFSLNNQADVINWTTPAANNAVYSGQTGIAFSQSLYANSSAGYAVTITANSLPSGLSLTGNVITGTPTVIANTATILTANANTTFKTATRLIYINIAQSADTYFYLTTFATHASANVSLANGTVISDASTNNVELTVAGTPKPSNFTPFGTGWSTSFTSTTPDYLTVGSGGSPLTALGLGTGAFTIEFWVYPISGPNTWNALVDINTYTSGILMRYQAGSDSLYILGTAYNWSPTTNLVLNVWSHVVLSRNGSGAFRLYVNGTSVLSGTNAGNLGSNGYMTINAAQHAAGQNLNAYYSNFRIVKGSAVYDPTVSTLTVPTSPLTAIANTSILTCQSNQIIDNSAGPLTITKSGAPIVQSFNPFNLTNTGSDGVMYFNGSTDFLTIASNAVYNLNGVDWTIECWFYAPTTPPAVTNLIQSQQGANNWDPYIGIGLNTNLTFYIVINAVGAYTSQTFSLNIWNHVALVRSGGVVTFYLNGAATSRTTTADISSTNLSWWIGKTDNAPGGGGYLYYYTGYLSNVRIVKGTAVYTGTFTPPTSALQAISNTSLLTLQNKYSHNTTQGHQDSSTNQLLISSNGSPAAGNFSPFSQTGWSNYFNGSSDYLTLGGTSFQAAMATGTSSNYTVECWVYLNALPAGSSYSNVFPILTCGSIYGMWSIADNGYLFLDRAGVGYINAAGTTPTVGTWNHLAFVNSGTSMTVYLNGTSVATASLTGTMSSGQITRIGYNAYSYFNGYISNLRVTTTVVYTGTFTPSTTPLTAITGTILLTCQSNRFVDNSASPYALTVSGTPKVQAFAPFAPAAEYNYTTIGGSVYLSGTSGEYMQIAQNNSLDLGTGAFTVECWMYPTSSWATTYNGLVMLGTGAAGGGPYTGWGIVLNTSTPSISWYRYDGSESNLAGTFNFKPSQWYHIAVSRASGTLSIFANGTRIYTGANTTSYSHVNSDPLVIGYRNDGVSGQTYLKAYVTGVRVVTGTAIYDPSLTTCTIPTAPLTSIANTSVLINGTSTALTDITSRVNLVTTSLAKVSNNRSKYGTASMYFGSGNYFTIPSTELNAFGSSDFTIETWIYLTSVAADTCIIDGRDGTGTAVKPCIFVQQSSGNFMYYVNGGIRIQGGTYSLNTWQHVAVSRSGTSTKMFVAGTQVGSTYTDSNSYLACAIRIGYFNDGSTTNSFNGNMDDLRITRYARYTANFTPMTETFKDK